MKKTFITLLITCCFSFAVFAQKTDTLTTPSGMKYFFTHKGNGPALTPGWIAIWDYTLTIDGKKIDATSDRGVPFAEKYPSDHLIKGSNEALSLMHIGDRATFIMPYTIAYGEKGNRGIPPKATLVFDMTLVDMKENSLESILDTLLLKDGQPQIPVVIAKFNELKKDNFKGLYMTENDLNDMGYQIIQKFPNDAVELFKLNVELYPKSYNVYDSLGEGYMDAGNKELAIANYQKSLELNPKNTNATDMIEKMKKP